MPAIITDQYRILNAETFIDSFVGIGTTGNNNYYSFLGHPNPKNVDVKNYGASDWGNPVPNPVDAFDQENFYYDSMLFLKKVTSNDVSMLFDGKVQYSCLPNGKGGIVDDLLVYRISANIYMLVVNASNIKKDWDWISMHNTKGVEMENISDRTSLLAVQGPKSVDSIQVLTDMNISDMKYYTFQKGTFAGKENVLISTTGYTGSGGFEIYFQN